MQTSLNLPSQVGYAITAKPTLSHWRFAALVAMALIVIVLLTLTLAALEVFLSGDQSLSALEAAMMVDPAN